MTDEMLIVVEEDFLFYNANTQINPVLMFDYDSRRHPRARRRGCKLAIFINTKHGWCKADHFLYGIQ
jgi:hypothetical protein